MNEIFIFSDMFLKLLETHLELFNGFFPQNVQKSIIV